MVFRKISEAGIEEVKLPKRSKRVRSFLKYWNEKKRLICP